MSDSIRVVTAEIYIQENGLIRLKSDGYLIGELYPELSFEDVVKKIKED